MSKFGSKEELLKSIEAIFNQMHSGKLSMDDLESLVEQTRELNERALILRYKAYEEQVFGEAKMNMEVISETMEEEIALPSKMNEVSDEFLTSDNSIEAQVTLPSTGLFEVTNEEMESPFEIETKKEEPKEAIFDFDVFNQVPEEKFVEEEIEEEEEIFENAATDSLEEELEEEIIHRSEEEFEQVENHSSEYTGEDDIEDLNEDFRVANFMEESMDHMDSSSSEDHLRESEFEVRSENTAPTEEEIVESQATTSFESKPVEPTFQQEVKTVSIFKSILDSNDNSTHLFISKLDTLIGAFGFNEKYQCIQELFNGSSEDFNQAIDVLDTLTNFQEAEKQLEFYVHLNKWDLESEIVAEFVRKIERRFR
jgi:hypothetical protein